MSLETTLSFLNQLHQNNNKEWFEDNRKQYNVARSAFEELVAEVVARFSSEVSELPPLDPKDTIHRINRDVRFSNDKSPYNTIMSALIGPEGRKSLAGAYYLRIGPGGQSLAASGAFGLTDKELQTVREHIAENARPLRAIIESPTFQKRIGAMTGDQVKTAPRGFAKDHPDIDLLRYKEFIAQTPFADAIVTGANFPDEVIATFSAAKPLTMHFDKLLGVRVKPEMHRHKKGE